MDDQNVVEYYSVLQRKKFWQCENNDEDWRLYATWTRKPDANGQILSYSSYLSYLELRFIETWKNSGGCQRLEEERVGSYYLIHTAFQIGMMKKFWRCILVMVVRQCEYSFFFCVWIFVMSLNCTLKMEKFVLRIFYNKYFLKLSINMSGILQYISKLVT